MMDIMRFFNAIHPTTVFVPRSVYFLASLVTLGWTGCISWDFDNEESGESSDSMSTMPTGAESSGGSTTGSEGGTTDDSGTSETGDSQDPLQACWDLPDAEIANLKIEPPQVSTAVSTPERITAAGRESWGLALKMLKIMDSQTYPTIAASPVAMNLSLGLALHRHHNTELCAPNIRRAMGFMEDDAMLHQTLGATRLALESRSLPMDSMGADPVVVSLSPSTWKMSGGEPAASSIQQLYGVSNYSVDKTGNNALSAIRNLINCTIEKQSDGLLTNFLPTTLPATDTTAFDIAVSYMQAPWEVELASAGTMNFLDDTGTLGSKPSASGKGMYVGLHENETFRAVDVPLRGGELGVLFVMPADNDSGVPVTLAALTEQLGVDEVQSALTEAQQVPALLTLPVVSIGSEVLDYIEPLGIECEMYTLRTILHGASIDINGKGIRAAAAAVAETWEDSGEPDWQPISVDRAFLFFIHDRSSNFVLFSGRFAG